MNPIDIALLIYFVILLIFMVKCRIEAGKINKEINQERGLGMSEFTESQLREMSDDQLNAALEIELNPSAEFVGSHYVETGDGIYPNVIKYKDWPNYRECPSYCSSPSDVMPLVIERKIGLQHFNRGTWQAVFSGDEVFSDKNPYRAAVCLILLMGK